MSKFDIGDLVPLQWELFLKDGVTPVDATVSVTVTKPDGTSSSPAVTHEATGVYTATYSPTTSGTHLYRWVATGAVTQAEEGPFDVRRAGSNLIPLATVRLRLNKEIRNLIADDEIQDMIDAAIAEYETFVGPISGTVTETADGGRDSIILASPVASEITAAAYIDGTEITVADLTVRNGIVRWGYGTAGRFTSGTQNVEITYRVGSLPANHREAIVADVAGYFAATQRGGTVRGDLPGEGYADAIDLTPRTLFPRIRDLAPPAVA